MAMLLGQNDSNKTMVTILVIGKLELFFKFINKKAQMGKLKSKKGCHGNSWLLMIFIDYDIK